MFSDKRGAELVLYKLKKTLPIGLGYLPPDFVTQKTYIL